MRELADKKYLLFDLDGTLTDPGIGITNSVKYALEHFNIYVNDRSELYRFIGPPLSESFEKFYGLSHNDSIRAISCYREYFTDKGIFENVLFDKTETTLKTLKKMDKKIIMATSKPLAFASRILEHFDISQYFDAQFGSELNGVRGKKDEVIAYALEQCKIEPQNAVMIGDRMHDIIGAKENKLIAVGVLFGYGTREELETAGADFIISDFDELIELF